MPNFLIEQDESYLAYVQGGSWIRFGTTGMVIEEVLDKFSQDLSGKTGQIYYRDLVDLDDGMLFTLAESAICYLKKITSAPSTTPRPATVTGSVVPYQLEFSAMGYYLIGTDIDGIQVIPWAGAIVGVHLSRAFAGSSGSTIVDVNKNGTTVYTTQANRPTIAYNDADKVVAATLPDVTSVAVGDRVTLDIDQTEAGGPGDLRCQVMIAPAF